MTWPTVRYSVGNEHDPGDPWGRSELVIHADGSARLDHHFSRGRETARLGLAMSTRPHWANYWPR